MRRNSLEASGGCVLSFLMTIGELVEGRAGLVSFPFFLVKDVPALVRCHCRYGAMSLASQITEKHRQHSKPTNRIKTQEQLQNPSLTQSPDFHQISPLELHWRHRHFRDHSTLHLHNLLPMLPLNSFSVNVSNIISHLFKPSNSHEQGGVEEGNALAP